MTTFAALRPKTCSYLTDDNTENKKAKGSKKGVAKRKLKFWDYKHCLEPTQRANKMNKLEIIKFMWIVLEKIINI